MESKIILGLEGISKSKAIELARKLGPKCYALKVHDLVDEYGFGIISDLKDHCPRIFLDYKLHDIPPTVYMRALAWKGHGVDILTVHSSGDRDMLIAAQDSGLSILAVTALTSLSEEQLLAQYGKNSVVKVTHSVIQALNLGLFGAVLSPLELPHINTGLDLFKGFEFVAAGVRSKGVSHGFQSRVATPKDAINNGATRIVVASQVLNSDDPEQEFASIEDEIK